MTAGEDTRSNRKSAMSNDTKPRSPWWRPLVDGVDRAVTPPANRLVRTNLFADSVAAMTRLEVRLRRRVERQSTWLLHQYNLPAAEDIRKVRGQLAAVEARLRDMSEQMEDQQRDAEAPRRTASRASAAPKIKRDAPVEPGR
jgi:hypothetical protein